MHQDFIRYANTKRNEYLLKTEKLFITNKNCWLNAFIEHFQLICSEINRLQNEYLLAGISYLEYNVLNTNFINRQYVSEIWVYGERQYLDKEQRLIGKYDISFLFVYFNELWDKLLSESKRYVGKVSTREITTIMLKTLTDFYSYLASIARLAIMECSDNDLFANIVKNCEFRVNIGSYMADTEPVFTESKNKDTRKLVKWFDEQLENKYFFGDYSNLDFSDNIFDYVDFRYARFQRSTLKNTIFIGSTLIGADFRNATMDGCRLDNCSIFEADFSNAMLLNTSFVNACGQTGLLNNKEWHQVGFLPVRFRYANLTNADFTDADLRGADFTGAILTGANFTDTVLDGSIFDNSIGRCG